MSEDLREVYNPPHIPDQSTLRDYQKECIDTIEKHSSGSHLIVLPTGAGKTYVFSHIPRHGRVLLLSHRDELVHQPQKYYDCTFGIEKAENHSNGEEVISASVQTLHRRLKNFDPYEFDMIITDEAHHAVADTYKKIYEYFKPRIHLGFTATPDRGDKKDLNKVFDDVIFYRDIRWGIKNGFLTDVNCIRVNVGYDLTKVKKTMGDFNQKQLNEALDNAEFPEAVAKTYEQYSVGQTLIFAANVKSANEISKLIPGSKVVTAETKNREDIINSFTNREFRCLINCMVFSEGTDMPLIETVIMARPTANQSLYCQAVGRGLRPHPGKKFLTLIDCVGASKLSLCTAPTLFGLNADLVPASRRDKISGMLSKMDVIINDAIDTPESWILNAEKIHLFEEENSLNLNNVNWTLLPDESLRCDIGNGKTVVVPASDALGKTKPYLIERKQSQEKVVGVMKEGDVQTCIDTIYTWLISKESGTRMIWDVNFIKNSWGERPITAKQLDFIKTLLRNVGRPFDKSILKITQQQATMIINRLKYEQENQNESHDSQNQKGTSNKNKYMVKCLMNNGQIENREFYASSEKQVYILAKAHKDVKKAIGKVQKVN